MRAVARFRLGPGATICDPRRITVMVRARLVNARLGHTYIRLTAQVCPESMPIRVRVRPQVQPKAISESDYLIPIFNTCLKYLPVRVRVRVVFRTHDHMSDWDRRGLQ